MARQQKSLKALIPGLLILASVLVVLGFGGLWWMQNSHGMSQWLLIAALMVGALLLLLGSLLIALPRLRTDTEACNSPSAGDRSTGDDATHPKRDVDKGEQDELLRTIQIINQNLDQVVGQVRTRLSGVVQASDDRNFTAHSETDSETPDSLEKEKRRIH